MITAIRGEVNQVYPGEVHVGLNSGLIVKVYCPVSSFSKIQSGMKIFLYTVLKQKDEDLMLYGFLEKAQRQFFEKLIAISGVGGKTALSFISSFSISELVEAVEGNDVTRLSSIPGIGKKTAQRIILELTGKLKIETEPIDEARRVLSDDLISGLVNLGYPTKSVSTMVHKIMTECPQEDSFEILFKMILKKISKI